MTLEQDLKEFDFSHLSKVRESLLQDLLTAQRNKKNKNHLFAGNMLTDAELDYAAAAGVNYAPKDRELTKF